MPEEKEKQNVRSFGSKLKDEREAREVSLEDISRITKISIHMLHAMEDDQWNTLPGGIFTRNFIRLYTEHLGLESERWVEEFKQYEKTVINAENEKENKEESGSSQLDLPSGWVWALMIFASLLLVGGYFVITSLQNKAPETQGADEASAEELPNSSENTARPAVEEAAIVSESQQEEALTVTLTERGRPSCWFKWSADDLNQSPPDGERLQKDIPRTFKAEEKVTLHLAHISDVELFVNGNKRQWNEFDLREITDDEGNVVSYIVTFLSEIQ